MIWFGKKLLLIPNANDMSVVVATDKRTQAPGSAISARYSN